MRLRPPPVALSLFSTVFIAAVLLMAAAGCGSGAPAATINPSTGIEWVSDGVVTEGEYASTLAVSPNFTLWWNSDGDYLYMAMRGAGEYNPGYVAVGFLPQNWTPEMQKLNADAVIGWVAAGQAYAVDVMFTGGLGPHPADGKNNVEMVSGSVSGNATTIEFRRKLSTGDILDQKLERGRNLIMWAIGANASDNGAHPERGYAEIEIK